MEKKVMKKDVDSRLFDIFNILILTIFTLIIVIPLWNVVVSSFASGSVLAKGDFVFWPSELSLENYRAVFRDGSMLQAFFISVSKTIFGVLTHVFFCAMIPTYLLFRQIGLLNSFWVYIIPALLSYYDVIILMNFFRNVPDSLEESAMIDGAGHWRIFLQIFLPLSKPALATIALFNGVNQWNDFMTARIFITDKALYPLQMKLYEIIVQSQTQGMQNIGTAVAESTTKGVQLATIVVTTIPILIIYPLLQKHFIAGMMVGAVKE
ncbi:carbohydrate ABC transporter permease [Enterococcus gallinarum]|uniref:carbohydrate ABC transporter permease n=1 Tax=Enterococcus gallinarum TaxID=1353 RepID=UPI003D0C5F78